MKLTAEQEQFQKDVNRLAAELEQVKENPQQMTETERNMQEKVREMLRMCGTKD